MLRQEASDAAVDIDYLPRLDRDQSFHIGVALDVGGLVHHVVLLSVAKTRNRGDFYIVKGIAQDGVFLRKVITAFRYSTNS